MSRSLSPAAGVWDPRWGRLPARDLRPAPAAAPGLSPDSPSRRPCGLRGRGLGSQRPRLCGLRWAPVQAEPRRRCRRRCTAAFRFLSRRRPAARAQPCEPGAAASQEQRARPAPPRARPTCRGGRGPAESPPTSCHSTLRDPLTGAHSHSPIRTQTPETDSHPTFTHLNTWPPSTPTYLHTQAHSDTPEQAYSYAHRHQGLSAHTHFHLYINTWLGIDLTLHPDIFAPSSSHTCTYSQLHKTQAHLPSWDPEHIYSHIYSRG